jgi:hypothetical protein
MTIHNLEEALSMPAFLPARNLSIPDTLRSLLPPITYRQFLIALIIVSIIPYLIALFGRLDGENGKGVCLLLGVQVVMLINVFAHAMMAVVMRGYTPGVITAFAVNLPFSVYLLRRAVKERWVPRRVMALLFPVGLIIHGLGLPALIFLFSSI